MNLQQIVVLAIQASIFCVVFGFGLKATPSDLRALLQRPALLLRSLFAVLVVMPAVAVVIARMFDIRPAAEIALIALAISPLPPLLPRRESNAGAYGSFALSLMLVLAALSIVTVPLSLEVLAQLFDKPLGASSGGVARVVLMTTLIPAAAGMAVRAMSAALADRIEPTATLIAKILLPFAALVLLTGLWRQIWDAIGGGAVIEMIVFVGVGLLVGDLCGRPHREYSIVLALSNTCRHPALALSIAAANFPNGQFAGTILLYLIVSGVLVTAYLKIRRATPVALPGVKTVKTPSR
jgi:BASS family bile acid:Na+ symporter